MSSLKSYKIALSLFCVIGAVAPVQASTNATVSTNFSQSFPNNADTDYIEDVDPRMISTTSSASSRLDSEGVSSAISVAAQAYATAGHIAVSAVINTSVQARAIDSQGNLNGSGGSGGNAWATARWGDRITIDAAGLSGQRGSFDAILHLSGILSVSGSGNARDTNPDGGIFLMNNSGLAYLSLTGTGLNPNNPPWGNECNGNIACAMNNPSTVVGSYNRGTPTMDVPVTVNFTFGSQADIAYILAAYSQAESGIHYYKMYGSGGVNAVADMSHTLLWGGINNVYDAQGHILSDFALSASSGFDYRNAAVVPLPAASWLFISGLLGLAGLSRRPA